LRGTSRREDGRDPGGPMDSAAALEGARRYLSGLQPEDHHGDGVAQPPYRVANPWGQGYDREPRAGASELPSTDPQPRVRCGKAASCKGRSRGLSCMKGNFHVQFLGEGVAATSPPYPTGEVAIPPCYPAGRCQAVPSGGRARARPDPAGPGGRRRGAWGGRTEAIGTLGASHVSRVPESGWPIPLSVLICGPDEGKMARKGLEMATFGEICYVDPNGATPFSVCSYV